MKILCIKCKTEKNLSSFYRNRGSKFGVMKICKKCHRKISGNFMKIYRDKKYFGMNRNLILERDNYQCQKCGMTNEEHKTKWNRGITIDHINGMGRNSKVKDNRLINLLTLCLSCHGRKDIQKYLNEIGRII